METTLPFKNRIQAAELLSERLLEFQNLNPLILAVPRGAVPMGDLIAKKLRGDLDVVLVRKIGAPGNPEYAVGAVTERGEVILTEEAQAFEFSAAYFRKAAQEEIERLQRRRQLYTPFLSPIPIENRLVIVVDDGIATGQTLLAAISAIRRQKPRQIVVASPISSKQALATLNRVAEKVVVLEVPEEFGAVSLFYKDFSEVSDEEVAAILGDRLPVGLPKASGND